MLLVNETLRRKFRVVKKDAIIISLSELAPVRKLERTRSEFSNMVDVYERSYGPGSVSWSARGGNYYVHCVM